MIKDYAKLTVGELEIDVNWCEEVIPCKRIRFKIDDRYHYVEHDEFYSMMMLFGNDQEQ
jgi:hypothetical protein